MGAGDVADFQSAGRILFSLGLVKGSDGNLSTWDGERLRITRTGSELAQLAEDDVLEGTLDAPPEGASIDLELHVRRYRERGPGALAHAHPPGGLPEGEGETHGAYAFAGTLRAAVEEIVTGARSSA